MPSRKPSRKASKKYSKKLVGGEAKDSYCVFCHKKTPTLKAHLSRTSNGRTMMRGVCKLCGHKKTLFVKSK